MLVEQSTENNNSFYILLTLNEYKLLRRRSNVNEVNYEKVLKRLILDVLHKKQT